MPTVTVHVFPNSFVASFDKAMERDGFWYLPGTDFPHVEALSRDFNAFRDSFNRLQLDTYVPTIGRYRRYAHFSYNVHDGIITLLPHGAYFQSSDANVLVGGIDRYFAECEPSTCQNSFFTSLVASNARLVSRRGSTAVLDVHVHQVRITATSIQPGQPSPEGIHSDGFDYVSMHLLTRHNVSGADTSVKSKDGTTLFDRSLTTGLDSLYIDDRRLLHYSSAFVPHSAGIAYRDMLLCSYRGVGEEAIS